MNALIQKAREYSHGDPAVKSILNELADEIERVDNLINTPEIESFRDGVILEAAHQSERWNTDHDGGKSILDWFWLIGYLAQKAAYCQLAGDIDKALHHTITTAAALAHWHGSILAESKGEKYPMRPGIEAPTEYEQRSLDKSLTHIAKQDCEVWGNQGHCLTDMTAVADRCWPCYARNALGMQGERE